MLLILIPVIMLIIGAVMISFNNRYDLDGWFFGTAVLIFAIGIVATLILGALTLCVIGATPGARIDAQKEYETINYQIENEFYSNSNEIGKTELINQIKEFNSNREQEIYYHNNIWTNWQSPIVYSAYPKIAFPAYLSAGGIE